MVRCNNFTFKDETTEQHQVESVSAPSVQLDSLDLVHICHLSPCLCLHVCACRWVHAMCQGLTTEDEVEVAADDGFDCSLCKTHGRGSYGKEHTFQW